MPNGTHRLLRDAVGRQRGVLLELADSGGGVLLADHRDHGPQLGGHDRRGISRMEEEVGEATGEEPRALLSHAGDDVPGDRRDLGATGRVRPTRPREPQEGRDDYLLSNGRMPRGREVVVHLRDGNDDGAVTTPEQRLAEVQEHGEVDIEALELVVRPLPVCPRRHLRLLEHRARIPRQHLQRDDLSPLVCVAQ